MLPISFEDLRYLGHSMRLDRNDAVVTREREILLGEIKSGDQGGFAVHNFDFS